MVTLLSSGIRCSISVVIWSLVGCILMIHFYFPLGPTNSLQGTLGSHSTHQLEASRDEGFQIPPPARVKRSRHARPKRPTTLIKEFLDDRSQLRHFFFPDQTTAIGPTKELGDDNLYFAPGKVWLDTDGNPIQAHGGGILYAQHTGIHYWYGENKNGPTYHAHKRGAPRVDIIGVSCYSSKDLWTWKNEGIVLAGEETNFTHDLYKLNVLERPKVIYNDKTGKYVMWMHVDDANYTKASVGIAVADYPTGPFDYLHSKRPHGFDSRDMTIFKDDDGVAYLIYSSRNNSELHVGPLTDDYLDVTNLMRRVLVGQRREAPSLFKYAGTYYMITSGCTGWAPNEANAHASESIMGPWEMLGDPCIGGNRATRSTTFFSQSTYVLPLPKHPGFYIFMADRWNPSQLNNSRYVWLPLTLGGAADKPLDYNFGFPLWSRVSIFWHRKWKLPTGWTGITKGADNKFI